MPTANDITRLLSEWSKGDATTLPQLVGEGDWASERVILKRGA